MNSNSVVDHILHYHIKIIIFSPCIDIASNRNVAGYNNFHILLCYIHVICQIQIIIFFLRGNTDYHCHNFCILNLYIL